MNTQECVLNECLEERKEDIIMKNNEEKVNEIMINYEGYEVVSFCKRISRSSNRVTIEITLEPIEEDPE